MSECKLIEAVRSGDLPALRRLLAAGAAVDERDEQGWTPLAWAAGRGDLEAVEALLVQGADCAAKGRDERTPATIARAAGRQEVAARLAAAERQRGLVAEPCPGRPYCRAYRLADLRRFDLWRQQPGDGLRDEDVVYVHQDVTVTRSMWHDEAVVFDEITPEWRAFCEQQLAFAVPADLY
jgi:hypothetical protein